MAALRTIAQDAQRAKTAFVSNVSHEFRTPLNMIIGLVDIMLESPEVYTTKLSPELKQDLRVVQRNSEHLASLINDVLDLTRADKELLVLHLECVDLGEIIRASTEAVSPLLEKKELTLEVDVPSDLPPVTCDPARVRQVILNLLSNAARFTEAGGIGVAARREDRRVLIKVSDTGPGIAPEDGDRIFEPFFRGTGELWRDKGGSGLGLSISRQFVRLHGGRLWFESTQGVGTSFYFTLPALPPVGHTLRPGHQMREDWVWREPAFRTDSAVSSEQLVRPRVVVCDETGSLWREFASCTDEVDFVDTRHLERAVDEANSHPARVVIVNATEPNRLWGLVNQARQEIEDTPIVGCCVHPRIERALQAGAVDYLIKPVTRADLQRVLQDGVKSIRRVLLVDDDPDILDLFTRMLLLCDATLEVTTALGGEQALTEMRARPPDLVLADVLMPGIDGWQLLRLMSEDDALRQVPVLLVSAQDPAEQRVTADALVVTKGGGLSPSKLLECSLDLADNLLRPVEESRQVRV
jgi:CheY-like chemotaxis protein